LIFIFTFFSLHMYGAGAHADETQRSRARSECSHVLYAPFCVWHKDSPARQMRSVSVARPRDPDPDAGSEREQPSTRDALN
jgi:hypothetical protein